MSDHQEQFECPYCGDMIWLPEKAPLGTECPTCGQPLGVRIPSAASIAVSYERHEKRKQAFESAPVISLQDVEPPAKVLALVPVDIAREFSVLPLSRSEDTLTLAVPGSIDFESLDKIQFILNCELEFAIAEEMEIRFAIERFYGG